MNLIIATLLVLLFALVLYTVFGGADFGAGIWEFNTALRANERERNLLYHAIGPVWETNHVWLIFVLVLMFGAFPPAFAAINEALFIPLLLGLLGIVFRGAAYAFRSQLGEQHRQQRTWIAVFALASVLAPMFLGAAVGAVASGKLSFDEAGNFNGSHLYGWVNSLSLFCGFFTVGLCAYVSATYMMLEASREQMPDLVSVWRKRALIVGTIMSVLAGAGLTLISLDYPHLEDGFYQRGWPAIASSIVFGLTSLYLIFKSKLGLAAICVSITASTVVVGWGLAQYPYVLPPAWTAEAAASHPNAIKLILGCTAIGMLFLLPAIFLLFKIFKMEPNQS